jgi:hypothetical protein
MRKATAFQPLAILVLTLCVSLCTACKADKGPRPEIGPGGYDVVVIESVCIPGLSNKIHANTVKWMPRNLLTEMLGRMNKP